jgi:penicillin amidase
MTMTTIPEAITRKTRLTLRKLIQGVTGGVAICLLLTVTGITLLLRGSLPAIDGELQVSGLQYPAVVSRDSKGVPTITGDTRNDVAYVTGFLHAQDRFFQMDLLRRTAAGELSALVGEKAIETDKAHRFHRFKARAQAVLESLPPDELMLLQHYADGVNAGLGHLAVSPFEYLILQQTPEPWSTTDSLLVVWSMYLNLQGNLEGREFGRGWLRENASQQQLAYLLPEMSRYDTPLDAASFKQGFVQVAIPTHGPAWFARTAQESDWHYAISQRSSVGSNSWAVSGDRSRHGGAIIADDMHLDLSLSHIWYRTVLRFTEAGGGQRTVAGITLPGVPSMIVGSNTEVAWGFTNSYGDYLDLVQVQQDKDSPQRFLTDKGWETAVMHKEILQVKDAAKQTVIIYETSLGPLRKVAGKFYAVRWIAHEPFAVNFGLTALETASSVQQALRIARTSGIPAQNFIAADSKGNIGWTIAGPLPDRPASFATTFPLSVQTGLLWSGRLPEDRYPRLINPSSGQLWTANNRQLKGSDYAAVGDGGADLGARARQIRDALQSIQQADEHQLYQIGLDDRALFLAQWRERALALLTDETVAGHPGRQQFRQILRASWTGRASVDSVGYQLARSFYYQLYLELFTGVDQQMAVAIPAADFDLANPRWPAVLENLLDSQPDGWLPPEESWQGIQLMAVDEVVRKLTGAGRSLSDATWGKRNTMRVNHPLITALPLLRYWLSAPPDQVAGDDHMPRVASPDFGQSQRMVVSPGRESEGIFNMPGGQSGHPLSPYFLAGHSEWVKGIPTPFMPGQPEHWLRLMPVSELDLPELATQ